MKLVDANVLIYAADRESALHAPAIDWLDSALAGRETVAFAWISLVAYIRITTHPSLFANPNSAEGAMDAVAGWLDVSTTAVLEPGSRHIELLKKCVRDARGAGDVVNDAHLAALALEHRADIVSFDHDFARFDGVRWIKPGR